jgi:hypothetical protein
MSDVAKDSTALLNGPPKNFYFLNKKSNSFRKRNEDNAPEEKSNEALEIGFEDENESVTPRDESSSTSLVSWLRNLVSQPRRHGYQFISDPTLPKVRMVPVKVEPKVFFANERTFLAWLHMGVTLASISVAIVA